MSASPTRRTRRLALLVLAAALCAPLAGLASAGDSCCPAMNRPCSGASEPCVSLAPSSCCDVTPAAAWPDAAQQRECSHASAPIRVMHELAEAPVAAAPPAAPLARLGSPPRLSVVLRN